SVADLRNDGLGGERAARDGGERSGDQPADCAPQHRAAGGKIGVRAHFFYRRSFRTELVRRKRALTPICASHTPAISPVLSAKLCSSKPALFSTVRCRFVSVVCSGSSMCWPPCSVPQPPPTRIFGSG